MLIGFTGCSALEVKLQNAKSNLGLDPGPEPIGAFVKVQIINESSLVNNSDILAYVQDLNYQAINHIQPAWQVTIEWSEVESQSSGVKTLHIVDTLPLWAPAGDKQGVRYADYSEGWVSVANSPTWQSTAGKEGIELGLQANVTGPVAPYAYGRFYDTQGIGASPRVLHDFCYREYLNPSGKLFTIPGSLGIPTGAPSLDFMGYITKPGQIANGGLND